MANAVACWQGARGGEVQTWCGEMVSRVGAWDELLSTCMEGEKPCNEMMMVHASGGFECHWAGEKGERIGPWEQEKKRERKAWS